MLKYLYVSSKEAIDGDGQLIASVIILVLYVQLTIPVLLNQVVLQTLQMEIGAGVQPLESTQLRIK